MVRIWAFRSCVSNIQLKKKKMETKLTNLRTKEYFAIAPIRQLKSEHWIIEGGRIDHRNAKNLHKLMAATGLHGWMNIT